MKMGTCHASGRSDKTDLLSPLDGLAFRDERFAEMEVARHNTTAVIDVHDITGEKEIVDQHYDAAVRRMHRRANTAAEIDAQVPGRQHAVEGTTRAEPARNCRQARAKKWFGPQWRSRMRSSSDFARASVFPIDSSLRLGVEGTGEA